jgi:hypothetical protein
MRKICTLLSILLCFWIFSGCSPKAPYDVVPIEGIVTWNGKPLPKEFGLKFRPENGANESTGFIKDNGKFVTFHTIEISGVPTGHCTVRIAWNGGDGTTPPPEYQPLLKKFGFQSEGLPLEIKKKDKSLKLDFPDERR